MRLWQWMWLWLWLWLVGLGAIETGEKWPWEQWEGGRQGGKGSVPPSALEGQASTPSLSTLLSILPIQNGPSRGELS